MLMFREEKSPEDEIKAWQFWHGRQHSVKQRILDAGKEEASRFRAAGNPEGCGSASFIAEEATAGPHGWVRGIGLDRA